VLNADIKKQHVDAIVNAANSSLLNGGGVDGAIHAPAGLELFEECRTLDGCRSGEARITRDTACQPSGSSTPWDPVRSGGERGEDALLANCYRNCFALAEQYGIRTVAFPADWRWLWSGIPASPCSRRD